MRKKNKRGKPHGQKGNPGEGEKKDKKNSAGKVERKIRWGGKQTGKNTTAGEKRREKGGQRRERKGNKN